MMSAGREPLPEIDEFLEAWITYLREKNDSYTSRLLIEAVTFRGGTEGLLEEAKTYLSGVAAVNVTDNQSSVMRLGSLAMCKALKDEGLTPIFQLACRDRNRIALESDLLSAAMFGI